MNAALAVMLAGSFASCSSDDDNSSVNNGSITEITNTAGSGTWRVTSYVEDGNDETHHFNGYTFTFGANGVLTAVNGDQTQTGAWAVTDSSSSDDDDSGSDIDFEIFFASPDEFADLTDDWDIEDVTATTISLIDVSGGNGGTDTLVFEKN